MSPDRKLPLLLLAAAATVGCKGKTVVKADTAVVDRLEECTKTGKRKDELIATYEAEIARMKLEAGPGGNELVMRIDGDTLAITARPAGATVPPADDKVAVELGQQFIENVRKSRGNIQKCYEQALKKNSALQARTISLEVVSKFGGGGAVARSTFRPDLGDAFEGCMQGVATKWKLTPPAQGMSFQATVTLSPS